MRKLCVSLSIFLVFTVCLSVFIRADSSKPKFPPPQPKYKVRVEPSIKIPMRDGVKLSTDLYFPEGLEEKLPVILRRTPYNKKRFHRPNSKTGPFMWAGQGYVMAVQDCRGRYESEGIYTVSMHEANDGYDTVEWLASQPWSNGKVGTYGCSYHGEVQILQSKLRNPHLKAMIPQAAGDSIGTAGNYNGFWCYRGGTIGLASVLGWFVEHGSKIFFRPPPGLSRETFLAVEKYFNPAAVPPDVDIQSIFESLPLIDMMKEAGGLITDFEDCISHGPGDSWWDGFGYIKDTDRFDVPAIHVNSWYDYGVGKTLYLFNLFKRNSESKLARDNQYVIISPTAHCGSEKIKGITFVGNRNMGDPQLDYWSIYFRWFDYWLKGIDSNITAMPKVQFYTMGKNEWQSASEWPLPDIRFTEYYFHSDGHANSRFGTGRLGTDKPGNELIDSYVYDPKTPVPSVGGPHIVPTGGEKNKPGSYDQSEVEIRHDILVYTSPVLKKGIEVTGPLQVVLYVSSSAKDTDFTAKLVDVYPDGTAYNIQEGIMRARYREGYGKEVFMKPGEVFAVNVDLHATSNFFGPGHRIRVEISSSNFPRFDRNLNTGGDNVSEVSWIEAENTIHHSKKYPSHIILPVRK